MNRMMLRNMAVLLVTAILLITPTMALADGVGDRYVATANGYQVELVFKEPAMTGENEFHIQIVDSMGMPVPNAEVEVSAMPVEGMSAHDENSETEMATEAPSVGVMTSNSSGMDMTTEVPSTGVMQPNEPAADEHGEEISRVMLKPTKESGEYAGEVHFDASGEWMFNVHFTINGETTQVDFPVEVARTLSANYAILTGFFGFNIAVVAMAAVFKRKSVVIRK